MQLGHPIATPIIYRSPVVDIDIRQQQQFDFWCRAFRVTRHQLASVVAAVGGNPEVVRRHLQRAA
jgi:Protein of unknown function (DUF3606)